MRIKTITIAMGLWAGSVLLVGCMTLEQMAPPVDARVVSAAGVYGGHADTMQRGRHVYLTRCADCHSIEPIDRYSLVQWEMILEDMSAEAKLTPDQAGDLEQYVMTIRRMQADGVFATDLATADRPATPAVVRGHE